MSHLGTDWELLEDLAVRNGFEVFVRGKALYFQAPGGQAPGDESKPVVLTWGDSLRGFTPRVTASGLPQTMRVRDLDDIQDQPVVSTRDIAQINGDFQREAGRFRNDVTATLFAGRGAVDQSGVGRRYLQPPGSMEEAGSPKFPEEPL